MEIKKENSENYIVVGGKKLMLTDEAATYLRVWNDIQTDVDNTIQTNIVESTNDIFEYYSMGDKYVGRRDPNMVNKVNEYKKRLVNELNVRVDDIPKIMELLDSNKYKNRFKFNNSKKENLFD